MSEGASRVQPEKNRGGEWVRIGDEEYRIPPLGFGALRELQGKIGALTATSDVITPEQMEAVLDIFHAAIRRNYPKITREDAEDMLDVGNFHAVLEAVMRISLTGREMPGETTTASQ